MSSNKISFSPQLHGAGLAVASDPEEPLCFVSLALMVSVWLFQLCSLWIVMVIGSQSHNSKRCLLVQLV